MNSLVVQVQLNLFAQREKHSSLVGDPREFELFLKLHLIAYRYSGVFSVILADAPLLYRLQELSINYQKDLEAGRGATAREARNRAVSSENPLTWSLTSAEDFWRIMAIAPAIPGDAGTVARVQHWFRCRQRAEERVEHVP